MNAPIGVRDNNPGNVDANNPPWQGQIGVSEQHSFAIFDTAVHGFRALARNLLSYQRHDGCNTLTAIIDRWAPPAVNGVFENDTQAYISDVEERIGIAADAPLDLEDRAVMFDLCKAIAYHEQGYDAWDEATMETGIEEAYS